MMTVEQKRLEEAAKRAAQRAMNQLRMSRRTLRAGAGQVFLIVGFDLVSRAVESLQGVYLPCLNSLMLAG